VRQALVAAAKRGVEIRVMLDAVAASSKFSIHKALREAGIEVRVEIMGGKMHAKTAVADGEHVLIGSMNWTAAGTADNDENTLWIRGNEKLAGEIGDWFESIWQWMPEVSGSDPKPEGLDSVNSCADGIDNDYDFQTDASDSGCRS
jgi:phosphatidylserine/phosphatidylglycerophosphate/cardiolipin synthase-like enzyme